MLPAMRFGGSDERGEEIWVAHFDFGNAITREGTVATVRLGPSFRPVFHADDLFGFEFARVNPACLGVDVTPAELVEAWDELEENGLPLEQVVQGLVMADFIDAIAGIPAKDPAYSHACYPAIPSFAHLVRTVGLFGEITKFPEHQREGFSQRVTELRRNLNGILKNIPPRMPSREAHYKAMHECLVSVSGKNSEFEVLRQFLRLGHRCEMPSSGPDFPLPELLPKPIKAEVKSRHENVFGMLLRRYTEESGVVFPVRLNAQVHFALLAWATFGTVRRAFQEQQADIMFCDLSHSFVGFLLSAVSQFWGMNQHFSTALERAEEIIGVGKQAVIVFVTMPSLHPVLEAVAVDKDAIEGLGRALWNMNKSLGLDSQELTKLFESVMKT